MVRVALYDNAAFRCRAAYRLPLAAELGKHLDLVRAFKAIPLQGNLVVGGFGGDEVRGGGNAARSGKWCVALISAGSFQEGEARN